tara:strand:+ start:492 stop:2333 length:1842 start_codon:yes stop_codon:yes gene_type:complete
MKRNRLKKTSILNLIGGYVLSVMFLILIILNRPIELASEELYLKNDQNLTKDLVSVDLFNGSHDKKIVYVNQHEDLFVRSNNIYEERVSRKIPNYEESTIVIKNRLPEGIKNIQLDRNIIAGGKLEKYNSFGNDNTTRIHDLHRGGSLPDGNRRDDIRSGLVENIDPRLLDRRLLELDNKKREGIDVSNLTIARNDDDAELGDIKYDFKKNSETNGGGELYAYNFPSQGVGAGIGASAIGAGAGGGAGLGAGIGEGIVDGKTVPTLGGVGTSRLIPKELEVNAENDKDGDGLPTITELQLGTDPNNADTDGDGAKDGEEVSQYSNPLDKDSTPQEPGNSPMAKSGGTGGLVSGAGAGSAAGLTQGYVIENLGLGSRALGKGNGYGRTLNYKHLPENGALHIMMHVDGSGSILDTRKQLEIMKDTLLKTALLPYYNNNEELFNRRVTIVSNAGERTLKFFAEAAEKNNVLAIAFQDEAQPSYHLPTFNKQPQDHYSKDINKLKNSLDNYEGTYRGVMFQVDRGKTFAKSFKEFVESAWRGEGYLQSNNLKKYHRERNLNHIKNKDGIVFSDEYHAKDSGGPQYYLDLIFQASRKVGLDLNIYGAGLTDGRNNNR